ncbi:MAG: bacillithiol biosynthesis deacetylase BshB1 [Armatimonadota bacterium]|nr:bacillithiol biosynthesis deacetylase BshB1 [Armatimonadota bacterium]MDR7437577.1 bacillithiol biosynthesis deacetylase BshB1 [Armatimonadota bacterium]MDR7472171.1 bacillithiol biosynthesis deacetylase BshB1 [Armatimonadota bacterium]MDR7507084.1 bacillithiol biosynthesis deacetylase BshB1 [Armatimonadota bacterium]MDR7508715.1 bacillithiol biosynthesis deacetylase BshB1 [Armatimonadota bacterium]
MRILAIGAHPDDVEIGMGGAVLILRAQGHEVTVCDLTDGEPTPVGTRERRLAEAAAAAGLLGVSRITLDLPNRELVDSIPHRRAVAEVIRRVRPDILFVPYWVDAHPDHVAACALAEAARFYAKLTHTTIPGDPVYPPRVIHFVTSHYRLALQPTFILDISPVIDRKLAAVRAYASQFGPERGAEDFVDRLRDLNRYYGHLIGCAYGEPFICREPLGLRGLDQLA